MRRSWTVAPGASDRGAISSTRAMTGDCDGLVGGVRSHETVNATETTANDDVIRAADRMSVRPRVACRWSRCTV
jgi:hypothetical protein